MSNLTPEQLAALQQIIQDAVKQQVGSSQLTRQTAEQLPNNLVGLFNVLPNVISKLITSPIDGISSSFMPLLNNLIGTMTNVMGPTGLLGDSIANNLVNIIKQEIPVSPQDDQ